MATINLSEFGVPSAQPSVVSGQSPTITGMDNTLETGGGKRSVPWHLRPTEIIDEQAAAILGVAPGEYVRDGDNAFPIDAVRAADGDFEALDPRLGVKEQSGGKTGWQGLRNYKLGGGGKGFKGTGRWAQIARAAGLGDQVGAGWMRNSPNLARLVQALGYGQQQMGANGTFVNQGLNGWQVFDRSGNVIQSGIGTAPANVYDQNAQSGFENQARDAILGVGGRLSQRLGAGGLPPQSPTDTIGMSGNTNRVGPAAERIVNGVTYRQNPNGSWNKIDGGTSPGGPLPPITQQIDPPTFPSTTRPPQLGLYSKSAFGNTGPMKPPEFSLSGMTPKVPDSGFEMGKLFGMNKKLTFK